MSEPDFIVPEGYYKIEYRGFSMILPADMEFPSGFTIQVLFDGFVEAGALELVDGKYVAPEGIQQGKLMGLEIGSDESRQLTEEELREALGPLQ